MATNEFDSRARGWDKESIHWERSKAIADRIIKMLPANNKIKALEYGAGTGILSFMLSDKLAEITLMDNSQEMVKVLREKVIENKSANLKPLIFNLEEAEYKTETFDFIYTQMVLHHVLNTELIISRFYDMLNSEGYLAIADLYKEDGSFHGEGFNGHNGFDVELLKESLEKTGFTDITTEQCFVMKKGSGNVMKDYPVFLMIAKKV
jgi:tRNA (cmo5U34)-methyltransferase